jgi:hypothetical protein
MKYGINLKSYVGFYVLTAVTMNNIVFRIVAPCSSELSLPPVSSAFFLDLFFGPEDESGMFLRNVDGLSPEHTASCPRSCNSTLSPLLEPSRIGHYFSIEQTGKLFPSKKIGQYMAEQRLS